MVIPSIYCCHTCSCSDNQIDIDLDFNDSSSDDETTPLMDNPSNKNQKNKKQKKTGKGNKQNGNKRGQNKGQHVFYFYYKHTDNTHALDSTISNCDLSEYIQSLNLGTIASMRFINMHDDVHHNLKYVKVTYKDIQKKVANYKSISQFYEYAIALYFNNAFVVHPILLSTIQANINAGSRYVLYNTNTNYYTIDYVLCMSRTKPHCNKSHSISGARNENITINNIETRPDAGDQNSCLPSSNPINVPIVTVTKNTIKHATYV